MNKIKLTLITLGLGSLFLFSGCSKDQPNLDNKFLKQQCVLPSGSVAPNWVCTGEVKSKELPNAKNYIFAVGIGIKQPLPDLQRQEAYASARDRLSQRISIKVKNMFKKFQSTTGIKKDMTVSRAEQFVSKQISSNVLNNSKVITMWSDQKSKDLYVLMALPKDNMKQKIVNATKTSFHNDKALWQKFLASKAYKELDNEFKKENQ